MLYDTTILVGLVYTSMLFMVVPLVSVLESLDDSPSKPPTWAATEADPADHHPMWRRGCAA
jgi:hypothetical protein